MVKLFFALCLVLSAFTGAARAQEDTYAVTSDEQSFSDAVIAVENNIINRGLKVDYRGYIGEMLKRTAKDVGASEKLYSNAEFFTFCSAVLSRKMMEDDISNIAYCPYVIFVYEKEIAPGSITIGFRKLPGGGERDAINTLLSEIVDSAAEGF